MIIFVAALVKAVLGFGESLVAMPLLTLVISVQTATPLMGLVATAITALILIKHWQAIDLRSVWRILLATAVGIPFGLLMLKIVPSAWVTHLLGALLIFYSLYTLLQTRWAKLEHPAWGYGFGFVSGALGSAYNTSGPPLVIYASLQRWSPEAFRATLQSCFLPTSLMILVGHALSGFWTPTVFALFGLSLPVILLAFGIGNVISRYILVEQFTMVVRVALLILGMMLLFKA